MAVLYPSDAPESSFSEPVFPVAQVHGANVDAQVESLKFDIEGSKPALEAMSVDQKSFDADPSLNSQASRGGTTVGALGTAAVFRFLDLPLELRLRIYELLLPPRTHTIVTQIPHNGYFYNSSTIPACSASSFYPFGRSPPTSSQVKYTTYKVISANFRSNFPTPSIHPEIFLVNKQILAEAEPVLYGSNQAVWDFGVHLDALVAFWGDRSIVARACVRNMRIAREIPGPSQLANIALNSEDNNTIDATWTKTCSFITSQFANLRTLDLTLWSSGGSTASFPSPAMAPALPSNPTLMTIDDDAHAIAKQQDLARQWREWDYTASLLNMPALRKAKVTWWGFQSSKGEDGGMHAGFDSWIAGRMVSDRIVRERMIRDGVVIEGVVVLGGVGA